MRFLLNMNVPRELGRRLAASGHSWRHVADIGMAEAPDVAIVEEARANGEVIVTHDLDYGQLLAFSRKASPSVIVLRVRNTQAHNLAARVLAAWPEAERPLREGAVLVLEDASMRIRRLPIGGGRE